MRYDMMYEDIDLKYDSNDMKYVIWAMIWKMI